MSDQPPPTAAENAVAGYVLLSTVPAEMGGVLDSIQPGMGGPLAGVPLLPAFEMGVNGAELQIGVFAEPVKDPGLRADLSISSLRATLEPALANHRAFIRLGISPPADFLDAMITWANVLAYLLERDDAAAVWLPYQQQVTTDVMFTGWMERDPAVNLTGVHAMWVDGSTSVAFTSGLAALGGRELQLSAAAEPAALFAALRDATADRVGRSQLPVAGGTLTVSGTPHQLVEATGLVDGRPVLSLVPSATPPAPAEQQKKRRWPFG